MCTDAEIVTDSCRTMKDNEMATEVEACLFQRV